MITVCNKCFEAVIRLYRGTSESILEVTCPYCGRTFSLDEKEY
jgi:hypothetical protein